MTQRKIDREAISQDIEGLTIQNLQKAYKRYKATTSRFKNLNVRDPLDYVDFEVNLANELRGIILRINSGNYHPRRPLIHYAPKNNGISRPTVSLHIEDVVVYRFCVEQIDEDLIKLTRQENIRGGVMASPLPIPEDGEYYEKWFKDWMEHNEAIHQALKKYPYIATTDISSYFDNVEVAVLVELLRNTIKNKTNLVSLLSFFLENIKLRYGYKTTLNTGLVQDDSDSSRILAYFYLHTHDVTMIDFANSIDAHFFRYVDDMNVVTKTKTDAKLALRRLTNSLRQLGLMASIEKTTISTRKKALSEMLYEENAALSEIDRAARAAINSDQDTKSACQSLQDYYKKLISEKYEQKKGWIKLLRRFYTIATYLQCDFLFADLKNHLVEYPSLVDTKKIHRYLIANQKNAHFNAAIDTLLDYLESKENLYPKVETQILESLCDLDLSGYTNSLRVEDMAYRFATGKTRRPLLAQSDFSKGIATLLWYKSDQDKSDDIADIFLSGAEEGEFTNRCLAIVSLTVPNVKKLEKVKNRLRTEVASEMKRLLNLVENMDSYKSKGSVKQSIKDTQFHLYNDDFTDRNGKPARKKIVLEYRPIRALLMQKLVEIHG